MSSDVCRVCFTEGTTEEPLFAPCRCAGSIKYVHEQCLLMWLARTRFVTTCRVCGAQFAVKRSENALSSLTFNDYAGYGLTLVKKALKTLLLVLVLLFTWVCLALASKVMLSVLFTVPNALDSNIGVFWHGYQQARQNPVPAVLYGSGFMVLCVAVLFWTLQCSEEINSQYYMICDRVRVRQGLPSWIDLGGRCLDELVEIADNDELMAAWIADHLNRSKGPMVCPPNLRPFSTGYNLNQTNMRFPPQPIFADAYNRDEEEVQANANEQEDVRLLDVVLQVDVRWVPVATALLFGSTVMFAFLFYITYQSYCCQSAALRAGLAALGVLPKTGKLATVLDFVLLGPNASHQIPSTVGVVSLALILNVVVVRYTELAMLPLLLRSTQGRAFVQAFNQVYCLLKVMMLLFMEIVMFPLGCGMLLHLSVVPYLKSPAQTLSYVASHQGRFLAVYIVLGYVFMNLVRLFLTSLTGFCRQGVFYFFARVSPNEVARVLRSHLLMPVPTQIRSFMVSAVFYAIIIFAISAIFGVWFVLAGKPVFAPLNWRAAMDAWPLFAAGMFVLYAKLEKQEEVDEDIPEEVKLSSILWLWLSDRVWLKVIYLAAKRLDLDSWLFNCRKENPSVVDGYFVRAPRRVTHYELRVSKHTFVPVTANNIRLDNGTPAVYEGEIANYQVVWRPRKFRWRVLGVCGAVWLAALALTVGIGQSSLLAGTLVDFVLRLNLSSAVLRLALGLSMVLPALSLWLYYKPPMEMAESRRFRQMHGALPSFNAWGLLAYYPAALLVTAICSRPNWHNSVAKILASVLFKALLLANCESLARQLASRRIMMYAFVPQLLQGPLPVWEKCVLLCCELAVAVVIDRLGAQGLYNCFVEGVLQERYTLGYKVENYSGPT